MRRGIRWRSAAIIALVGLLAGAACGCHWLLSWATAPRHPKETIKAEYPLEAEKLVIVPYAGTEILFSDPTATLEVSSEIVNEILSTLGTRVKTIVHPVQVNQWQESNVEWPNMSLTDMAKAFQADTLLYVELERYSMIEENSANLYRGHVRARIQVVKAGAAHNPVYETTVETAFPEDQPVGMLDTSERVVRTGTNRWFARDVVNKFHDFEKEVRGGNP